jgi:hypothetical protein
MAYTALTKQTTITYLEQPKWDPNPGMIEPYEMAEEDHAAFLELLKAGVASGKTNGVQYSVTVGISIRRWADTAAVEEYRQFVIPTMMTKYGVPENAYTFTVEDI